jgi:hypothetical protein
MYSMLSFMKFKNMYFICTYHFIFFKETKTDTRKLSFLFSCAGVEENEDKR